MFKKYPVEKSLTASQKNLIKAFNENISAGEVALENYNCVICGENRPISIFDNDVWGISNKTCYCGSCGLVFSNPRMTEESQNSFYSSDTYREIYEPITQFSSHIVKAEEKVSKIRTALKRSRGNQGVWFLDELLKNTNMEKIESICEIGSGSGANLIPFIDSRIDSYGVELSPSLSEFAEKLGVLGTYKSIDDINK